MIPDYPPYEKRVIDSEGSRYTDGVHPFDPGGPTRWGITLTDARLHWKSNATAEDVRLMPLAVALAIYKSKYWDAVNADALPAGLDGSVFDYGVNSGIGRAGKVLRRLLGLSDHTSVINAEVLVAVAKRDMKALITAINAERLKFLQSLAIWPTYKNGWTTRVNGVEAFSIALAANPAMATSAPTLDKTVHIAIGQPIQPPTPAEQSVDPNAAQDTAKGMIPPPTAAKTAVTGTAVTAAGGSGYSAWDWVTSHQVASIAIAGCVVILVATIIKVLNDSHKSAQEARTPGVAVVPEITKA